MVTPTPFESAQLNLQLFDLRREAVLREARSWFLMEFDPQSIQDVLAALQSERNDSFRMVLGYWDMAASMVGSGAIDAQSFLAAHGEIIATFAKLQPFLAELRAAAQEPELFKHIEAVVLAAPNAEALLASRREAVRLSMKARRKKASS